MSNLKTDPLRTSFDLYIQETVDQLADKAIEHYRPLGAGNVAVIVAEKESGGILGIWVQIFTTMKHMPGANKLCHDSPFRWEHLKALHLCAGSCN